MIRKFDWWSMEGFGWLLCLAGSGAVAYWYLNGRLSAAERALAKLI